MVMKTVVVFKTQWRSRVQLVIKTVVVFTLESERRSDVREPSKESLDLEESRASARRLDLSKPS